MYLHRKGMPLPLVTEWFDHAKMDTTRQFYANADTTMKKKAMDKAISELSPLFPDESSE